MWTADTTSWDFEMFAEQRDLERIPHLLFDGRILMIQIRFVQDDNLPVS
jgi:hypothetical protein